MERIFLIFLVNLFYVFSLKKNKTKTNVFFGELAGPWYFTDCELKFKAVQIARIGAECLIPSLSLRYQRRTGHVSCALSSKASCSRPPRMFFSPAF